MKPAGSLADARHFSHDAMHSTFSLRLRGVDADTARDIARECFDLLDSLETKLSRFVEGGDVSRINQMRAGETLYISEACHQCLLLALDAHARTGGLFDITLGSRIEHRKSCDSGPLPQLTGSLIIHPDVPAVTCTEAGRVLDLGGIGKGFALDQLKRILADWGAEDALLSAGASSLLAYGPTAWPVELGGARESIRIHLRDQSLSASGTGIQGSHIVHPAGADAMPAAPCERIWVISATAALAEIWSTALMLVDTQEIPGLLAVEGDLYEVYTEWNGAITPGFPCHG
ncbi:MAG: FAD:protein FMN transferase [Luteolibacter sp.]|jgi:thiamine biosynthesis lipoprotein|nr:FAD:protein FMN transferase [Luteolibacter sp.]